jgi:hypothetical protein
MSPDAAACRHSAEPIAKARGGHPSHRATEPLPPGPATQGFAPGGTHVGEVEVLDHHRRAVPPVGRVEQCGDGRPDMSVPLGCGQSGCGRRDRVGFADGIARRVEHTARQMVGVEVHTQHPPGPQRQRTTRHDTHYHSVSRTYHYPTNSSYPASTATTPRRMAAMARFAVALDSGVGAAIRT